VTIALRSKGRGKGAGKKVVKMNSNQRLCKWRHQKERSMMSTRRCSGKRITCLLPTRWVIRLPPLPLTKNAGVLVIDLHAVQKKRMFSGPPLDKGGKEEGGQPFEHWGARRFTASPF